MTTYINKRIYTDIESWMVTEIDEARGTAMATPVKKNIRPKMIPGGFAGHCPDLDREFDAAEPVIAGKPFPIRRNKAGIWGYMRPRWSFAINEDMLAMPFDRYLADNPQATEVEKDNYGRRQAVTYLRTKTGKIQMTFEKLGKICDHCDYFYDYNF